MLTARPLTDNIRASHCPISSTRTRLVPFCLQCVVAYGELLAALPPILQTFFFPSAPRFPDGGCPVRLAVRQAALPTFPRSSPAATAGPSFPLLLIYSRWTIPRVVLRPSFTRACTPLFFCSSRITICGVDVRNI